MSGNSANSRQWTGSEVYINTTSGTVGPTDLTTAWPAGWDAVGLLDGDEGLTMARDEDSSKTYAWGGILVKAVKSKHVRTVSFVCLEDNATTFALINPGSTRATASGVTTSTVKVPKYVDFAIGFELTDGLNKTRRSVKRATIDKVEDVKDSEGEVTAYKVTVAIYPESDGTLYKEVSGAA